MTLVSSIITSGYREANYSAVGDEPTTAEVAEGLTLLQSLSDSLFPLVVGTKLALWPIPRPLKTSSKAANYPAQPGDAGIQPPNDVLHPPANVRLMMAVTEPTTVYFQYQPQDGALMEFVDVGCRANVTFDANGMLFGSTGFTGTEVIEQDYPTNRMPRKRWIFRADIGSWIEVSNLELTAELPYPSWFDDWFVTALAMRLSPRAGQDPRAITLARNQAMTVFIRGQYEQMGISIVGSPAGRGAVQAWDSGENFEQGDFDQGIV